MRAKKFDWLEAVLYQYLSHFNGATLCPNHTTHSVSLKEKGRVKGGQRGKGGVREPHTFRKGQEVGVGGGGGGESKRNLWERAGAGGGNCGPKNAGRRISWRVRSLSRKIPGLWPRRILDCIDGRDLPAVSSTLARMKVQCRQLHAWLLPKTQPRSVSSELGHDIKETRMSAIRYNVTANLCLSCQ